MLNGNIQIKKTSTTGKETLLRSLSAGEIFTHAAAIAEGTDQTEQGLQLRSRLSYYQIARSIGITYEECIRLFKQIQSVLSYHRGGTILVLDPERLDEIAQGRGY